MKKNLLLFLCLFSFLTKAQNIIHPEKNSQNRIEDGKLRLDSIIGQFKCYFLYDTKGRNISFIRIIGTECSRTEFLYNDKDQIIQSDVFDSVYHRSKSINSYNSNGKLSKKIYYYNATLGLELNSETIYAYDSLNRIKQTSYYSFISGNSTGKTETIYGDLNIIKNSYSYGNGLTGEDLLREETIYSSKEKKPGEELVHTEEKYENNQLKYGIRSQKSYDAEGRIVSIVKSSKGTDGIWSYYEKEDFLYNATKNVDYVLKSYWRSASSNWEPVTTNKYLYDPAFQKTDLIVPEYWGLSKKIISILYFGSDTTLLEDEEKYYYTNLTLTVVPEVSDKIKSVKIFPNPARNEVCIDAPFNIEHGSIEFFQLNGQSILKNEFVKAQPISIAHLNRGEYYYLIKHKGKGQYGKLILE